MSPEMQPSVAILGAGAMGEILAVGLLRAGWSLDDIVMVARRPERAKEAQRLTEIRTILDPVAAVNGHDVVVVAVKPKDVPDLLDQVGEAISADQRDFAGRRRAAIRFRAGPTRSAGDPVDAEHPGSRGGGDERLLRGHQRR